MSKKTTETDKTRFEQLPVSQLNICEAYQRRVFRSAVNRIKRKFDPAALGHIVVGCRKDGSYWVIDGQQRLTAVRELGHKKVSCCILPSAGSADEARIFRIINGGRKNITSNELFVAAVESGDTQSVAILACLERCGFSFHPNSGGGLRGYNKLRNVTPLIRMFEVGGSELIERVLRVVTKAWKNEEQPTSAVVLNGLTRFFQKFPKAEDQRVASVLSKLSPESLIRHSNDARLLMGGNRDVVVCNAIVANYNKRLGAERRLGVTMDE